ncbi:MAG: phosphate/phosphite/phosphonate ABC transporter substrate-binding protein [Desulfobulbaceae bacterium]|nr:phosphate/phosphite/phosphonate ABC transporter substrate-binding protein [Desulfobulbaceae bacterium]HIJ91039.1 phosphate/phosphite/phosphonate ABC transporter substrate-binding protein [Deltaproteobacteria bacterium]
MHSFIKRVLLAVAAVFLLSTSLYAAPKGDTLILGVFPYISANQMMEQLSPLCKRIEAALGKKVTMVSAPDFLSYVERTAKGEYDLVLTAPHMGRLAQKRDGWQLVVQSGQKTATVILVRKESPIRKLEDLRGKKMAVGNWRSVTYLLAEEALAQKGVTLGKDVEVLETATFSNVVQSVFLGEADAGATPTLLWDKWINVNEEQHRQLREIFRAKPATPSFLVMANPKADQATIQRLRESLLSFKDTPEGKDFMQKSQFESFLPLDDATMARIDPYVHVLVQPR